mgnify:CR=1 FL=1
MINIIHVAFIPGVMVGLEWDYEGKFVILDLFIIRIVWDYWSYRGEVGEEED